MPATRPSIAEDIRSGKNVGMVSMVLDLEDAIGDLQVQSAEDNVLKQLLQLQSFVQSGIMSEEDMPIIFIRVRSPEQMKRVIVELEDTLAWVAGFVLPKFSMSNCQLYLDIVRDYNQQKSSTMPVLYVMPILESCDIIYLESRANTLFELKKVLHEFKDYVLNVRIGATDFSSLFGLRRSPDMTIYDIGVIRDCIADIVNIFGRADDNYVISGPYGSISRANEY